MKFCGLMSLILFFVFSMTACVNKHTISQQQTVILIGLDGLRPDSISPLNSPNLFGLSQNGVKAGLIPSMPTKTFTNFYSLATGLYAENHGMVGNYPYDKKMGRVFNRRTDITDPSWWGGEPIWVTAEKQGVISATYFWVGSEVAIDNVQASYWKKYNKQKDYAERVKEVLAWLDLPQAERPQFISLYFSAVDSAAHRYGINSDEELAALANVDAHIGALIQGLSERNMLDHTNIMVVSDHGMVDLSDDKIINLDLWVNNLEHFVIPERHPTRDKLYSPYLNIFGSPKEIEILANSLAGKHPMLSIYKKNQMPEHFKFDHATRGPDLSLVAQTGWSIYASRSNTPPTPYFEKGDFIATHGYDNMAAEMLATFIGKGPAFKKEANQVANFKNVEVYNMIACMLNITPSKNDGDIKRVEHLLAITCD